MKQHCSSLGLLPKLRLSFRQWIALDRIDKKLATDASDKQYLPAISAAVAMGKKLLNHCYELTDLSEVYRIAMSMYSLNP